MPSAIKWIWLILHLPGPSIRSSAHPIVSLPTIHIAHVCLLFLVWWWKLLDLQHVDSQHVHSHWSLWHIWNFFLQSHLLKKTFRCVIHTLQILTFKSKLSQIERVLFLKVFDSLVKNMQRYCPEFHGRCTVHDNWKCDFSLKITTNVVKLNLHSQYTKSAKFTCRIYLQKLLVQLTFISNFQMCRAW